MDSGPGRPFNGELHLSRRAHDFLGRMGVWKHHPEVSQSLCARAWWLKDHYTFWKVWAWVWTHSHCSESHQRYWREET